MTTSESPILASGLLVGGYGGDVTVSDRPSNAANIRLTTGVVVGGKNNGVSAVRTHTSTLTINDGGHVAANGAGQIGDYHKGLLTIDTGGRFTNNADLMLMNIGGPQRGVDDTSSGKVVVRGNNSLFDITEQGKHGVLKVADFSEGTVEVSAGGTVRTWDANVSQPANNVHGRGVITVGTNGTFEAVNAANVYKNGLIEVYPSGTGNTTKWKNQGGNIDIKTTGTFSAINDSVNNGTFTIETDATYQANTAWTDNGGLIVINAAGGGPVGHFELHGNFRQTPTGTVGIDVHGGLNHDILDVTGAGGHTELSGFADVSLGYTPVPWTTGGNGDWIPFLTSTQSLVGQFDALNLPDPNSLGLPTPPNGIGYNWRVIYDRTDAHDVGLEAESPLFVSQPWTGNGKYDVVLLLEETYYPNSPPYGAPDSYYVWHDTVLNVTAPGVLANDSDPESDPITATLATGAEHGTVSLNADGSFSYTPNAGFAGADSFSYRVVDGFYASEPIEVAIDVQNDQPYAQDDSFFVWWRDDVLSDNVLTNDSDTDPLTVTLVSDVDHGTLSLNSDGSFTYTPNGSYVGSDTFVYEASDGIDTDQATVVIDVQNDQPYAQDDWFFTEVDMPYSDNVIWNDSDTDPLTASVISGPSSGSLTFNSDGSFTYTPSSGFEGTDSFTYEIDDGMATSQATATIDVYDWQYLTFAGDANEADLQLEPLTVADVQLAAEGAVASWARAGVDRELLTQVLAGLDVHVVDMPGVRLGAAAPGKLIVDTDAAGHGWFVDATPLQSEEFESVDEVYSLASADAKAWSKVDLVTTLTHEIGHLLGLYDLPEQPGSQNVRTETIGLGIRRFASSADVQQIERLHSTNSALWQSTNESSSNESSGGAATTASNDAERDFWVELVDEVFKELRLDV